MTDDVFDRLVADLRLVPLVNEADVELLQDGRWLYEPSCRECGIPLDRRTRGCWTCICRHEKRRQRGGRAPHPPFRPRRTAP